MITLWKVYLYDRLIDIVPFDYRCWGIEVLHNLISYYGYDSHIEVCCAIENDLQSC